MMKWVILLLLFVLRCEQSTIVFDPVTNKAATASTAPTQGTVTVNVDLSVLVNAPYNKLLNNQVFTVSVYGATGLVAGIVDDGTGTTSATGTASVILKASDVSNCITATDATLPNGTYYYYFSINYNGQARTVANTDSAANGTGLGCGANGFIQSSTGGNMYASRGTISVNGNTTVTINDTNTAPAQQHTFQFGTGTAMNFRCFVTHADFSAYTANTPLISLFALSTGADGSTTGKSGNTHLLPAGAYRYFCYADAQPNGLFFEAPTDKLATGSLNVNGMGTTFLNLGSFLPL